MHACMNELMDSMPFAAANIRPSRNVQQLVHIEEETAQIFISSWAGFKSSWATLNKLHSLSESQFTHL